MHSLIPERQLAYSLQVCIAFRRICRECFFKLRVCLSQSRLCRWSNGMVFQIRIQYTDILQAAVQALSVKS